MDDFVLLDKFREKLEKIRGQIPADIKTLIERFINVPEPPLVLLRSKSKTRKNLSCRFNKNHTRRIVRRKNHCTRKNNHNNKKSNGNHTRKIKS